MGCGESTILNYKVQYCRLDPIQSEENSFIIQLLAEEEYPKTEGLKLFNQIENTNSSEIIQFLERPNFKENTIFYFFLSEEPIIKTFKQATKYIPFNMPLLSKIIMLSIDNTSEYPKQIIENETSHLAQNKFIKKVLNFNEIKKQLDKANNPNITKDSLSLKDNSINLDENESIKEKEGEIVISEDVSKDTFMHIVSRFENERNTQGTNTNINVNLETSSDHHNNKEHNNNCHIKSVKFYLSKFNDINILNKIMGFLAKKDIKKFSFYENKINADFEGWDGINNFLENNFALRYLDLHGSNLYDNHLSSLTRALVNKRIRFLNLSENFITFDGVEIIASFLKNNKTLQKLNLSRNGQNLFKVEGVKLITDVLMSSTNIKFIDFSYMNLTGCGEPIGNFISNNKSIEDIALREVHLNINDFKNIFVPLKNNKVLKIIDISMNDMGGDKSLQYIAEAISENKTLHTLKIEKININNDNYKIIFDAIEKNKTISSYSVSYNSKIKPKILLNFFLKQKQVKHLEYEPFDKENPEDQKKELTLDDKKLFEKIKNERPDMVLIYK